MLPHSLTHLLKATIMIITAYVLGALRNMVRVGTDLQIWNPAFLKEGKCSLTLRVDSRTDRLRALTKYERSKESFAREATMLMAYKCQEKYNRIIDFSRDGLNLEDLDHELTISVDIHHDE